MLIFPMFMLYRLDIGHCAPASFGPGEDGGQEGKQREAETESEDARRASVASASDARA